MTNLSFHRRVAARILGVGANRVRFKQDKINEIKEALTADDIRDLIKKGYIYYKEYVGQSRLRARILHEKRKKGRRRGKGSRKGSRGARVGKKEAWVRKVRAQRKFLKKIKRKLPKEVYWDVYYKIKGGFFRSVEHIKIYISKFLK